MATYKLRLTVDAEQFLVKRPPWPGGVYEVQRGEIVDSPYAVKTRTGPIPIFDTDWVITNPVNGDRRVLSDPDFQATYEVPA